jgi:hypothetical protein
MIKDNKEELAFSQVMDNFYNNFYALVLATNDTATLDKLEILSKSFNELVAKYETVLFEN